MPSFTKCDRCQVEFEPDLKFCTICGKPTTITQPDFTETPAAANTHDTPDETVRSNRTSKLETAFSDQMPAQKVVPSPNLDASVPVNSGLSRQTWLTILIAVVVLLQLALTVAGYMTTKTLSIASAKAKQELADVTREKARVEEELANKKQEDARLEEKIAGKKQDEAKLDREFADKKQDKVKLDTAFADKKQDKVQLDTAFAREKAKFDDVKAKLDDLVERLAFAEGKLKKVNADIVVASNTLNKLNRSNRKARSEVAKWEHKLRGLRLEHAQTTLQVKDLRKQLAGIRNSDDLRTRRNSRRG